MNAFKQNKRLESKKRKAKAFLDLVKANEADGLKNRRHKIEQKVRVTYDSSSTDSEDAGDEKSIASNSDAGPSGAVNQQKHVMSTSVKHTQDGEPPPKKLNISEEEYTRIKTEIRARQKEAMQRPKIFLTLDEMQPHVSTPKHFPTIPPQMKDEEEVDLSLPTYQPHLFMLDVQHLLLYAIQGNTASYKPRWCKLLRWQKVSHIAVVTVQGLSYEEYTQHKDCFERLKSSFDVEVELVSPYQYGSTVEEELLQVPLSVTKMKKWKIKENDGPNLEKTKGEKQEKEDKTADNCTKTMLILRPEQLIQEDYPLPVGREGGRCANYVFSKDSYGKVSDSSPLFSIDCEMCLTTSNKRLELTRVSVVNEKGKVIYDKLVKPRNRIINYLTKYSGITEKMLSSVTTTLQDVQRDIQNMLPSNAILVGQSLNGDLHALELFHPYCIDTSVIYNLTGNRKIKSGLKRLTAQFLGRSIQDSSRHGHDSAEDATAALDLVLLKLRNNISFGDVLFGGVIYPNQSQGSAGTQTTDGSKNIQSVGRTEDTQSCSQEMLDSSQSNNETTNDIDMKTDEGNMNANISQRQVTSCVAQSGMNKTDDQQEISPNSSLIVGQGPCLFSMNVGDNKRVFFRSSSPQAYQSLVGILDDFCKTSVCICKSDDKVKDHKMEFCACSSDKKATKMAKKKVVDCSFTYVELNGFDPSQKDANTVQESLQDLDRRINKIHQNMPDNGMFIVLLSGRLPVSSTHSAGALVSIKKSCGTINS